MSHSLSRAVIISGGVITNARCPLMVVFAVYSASQYPTKCGVKFRRGPGETEPPAVTHCLANKSAPNNRSMRLGVPKFGSASCNLDMFFHLLFGGTGWAGWSTVTFERLTASTGIL